MKIVYVLTNPAMQGRLKIGKTDKDDVAIRMKELYGTGVPLPYDCLYACVVEDNDFVEKTMHEKFAKYRSNPDREFFTAKPISVVRAIKPYELSDVTPAFREEGDSFLSEAEKTARWKDRRKLERAFPELKRTKDMHMEVKK